jgi:hypothetical protein
MALAGMDEDLSLEEQLMKEDDEDATNMISQESSWQVISSYFEAKGLVRQQLVRSRLAQRKAWAALSRHVHSLAAAGCAQGSPALVRCPAPRAAAAARAPRASPPLSRSLADLSARRTHSTSSFRTRCRR